MDNHALKPNSIHCGPCELLIPRLRDGGVNLVVTSPPYAEQRKRQYSGIPEKSYPAWMTSIMDLLRPKLAPNASVLTVIRPHIKAGCISDYVLRTRLALREDGWTECEELIWLKTDAPPLGSYNRPRRSWEHILWFAKNGRPYVNLRAKGQQSERIGFEGSGRFGVGSRALVRGRTHCRKGTARIPDVVNAYVTEIARGVRHPAMFPQSLAEHLIQTFSRPNDVVLDPFVGSGTSLLAAHHTGRHYIGFDLCPDYVAICRSRLRLPLVA